MAPDNKSLGKFILDGIPPAPRGVPQIEVAFDINADGILHVNARDKATGREQKMQIIPSSGLTDSEIDNMVSEAEKHAAEDSQRKDSVEAVNMADSAVYSAEKFLSENGDKLPEATKASVQSQIDATKSALEGGDLEAIKSTSDQLQAVMQEAGAALYQQQQAAEEAPGADQGGGPTEEAGESPDEDVIDGEFSDA
jgi:molecular chaperone DnaK